jgi:SAM-dependent methyltransferase
MPREHQPDNSALADRLARTCPVCGNAATQARLFLEEKIDPSRLNNFSFASRKEPEFLNYHMMQCLTCDLVYVDQPPSQQALADAYHVAEYDSTEEANDAATAYMRQLGPVLAKVGHESALEIGTGTGVLLEKLAEAGFRNVTGVEPSAAAIAAAPSHRHGWIREGIFQETDFEPASFDLICCFMTLEHVRDPMQIAQSVLRLLRPGGAFVTVTHDYRSAVNRWLGRRSPIIDVEHMQLFSSKSINELFQRAGYVDIEAQPFANRYALAYWTRLLPLGSPAKRALIKAEHALRLANRKFSINVGNTFAAGFRPNEAEETAS